MCSGTCDSQSSNTEHRTQNTEHRTQNTEHRTQNTEHRTQNTEHRTQNTASAKWLKSTVLLHHFSHVCTVSSSIPGFRSKIVRDTKLSTTGGFPRCHAQGCPSLRPHLVGGSATIRFCVVLRTACTARRVALVAPVCGHFWRCGGLVSSESLALHDAVLMTGNLVLFR